MSVPNIDRFVNEGEIIGWRTMRYVGRSGDSSIIAGNTINDPLYCNGNFGYANITHLKHDYVGTSQQVSEVYQLNHLTPECTCGFYLLKSKAVYFVSSILAEVSYKTLLLSFVVNSTLHGLVVDHGDYYRCDRYTANYFVIPRDSIYQKWFQTKNPLSFKEYSAEVVSEVSVVLGVDGFVGNVKTAGVC